MSNDVTVVGSGPTGLMLAGELALAGADVAIIERRLTPALAGARARGFHSRTIELLDQRGLADRFLDAGHTVAAMTFAGTPLPISSLSTRHPYTLALGQSAIEQILLGWVDELGVLIRRGLEVTGFAQDATGVDVHVRGGRSLRTGYLVGADGGRSVVREAADIEFVGPEASRSYMIAEVAVSDDIANGMRLDDVGVHAMSVMDDGRTVGIVVTERELVTAAEPTLADLRAALTAVYGTDFGVHNATWISRFTDATRQAAAYRSGRVLLAGDAAHVHPPTGGQGIGLGVQDAVNLGWKLAHVALGLSPDVLLDSYHAERHPATGRVLRNVMVQASLQRGDARTAAMRETFAGLLSCDESRAQLAGLLSGLDVRYAAKGPHPLLGYRMPDLDIATRDGTRRVFELVHGGRPVLLSLRERGTINIDPWASRVELVEATCTSTWELPVTGSVPAPSAVLIRPDGHVAWAGDGTQAGLTEALTTWFGQPDDRAIH